MSEQTREFTKGDLAVSLLAELYKANGIAVNLADYSSPSFAFRMVLKSNPASVKVNNVAAVIVQNNPCQVRYDWVAGDVDTVADYYGWFVMTVAGGKTQRFPVGRNLIISIKPGD